MTIRSIEIEPSDRVRILNEFSVVHEGWLVSLDVMSLALGVHPEVVDLPLVSVTFEPHGRGSLVITAGSPRGHVTHVIQAPTRLWVERTDTGIDVALGIESADGTKTILRFRTPALPETVDGVARLR